MPSHTNTSSPIPFALPSSSFCSMFPAQPGDMSAFHAALRSDQPKLQQREHCQASADLHHCSSWPCNQPHTHGWATCTYIHVHRKWGCGMPPAPTGCLSCVGEGNTAVQSWQMHFFPKWHHAPQFCRQSKKRHCHLLVRYIGVGASDLGSWFWDAMDIMSPDQGLGLSTRPHHNIKNQICLVVSIFVGLLLDMIWRGACAH